ncbi:hypothetical protein A9Q84_07570 [Halobacteriovorax marinus]|uniref:Periplasmic chaperone PpiD n=1 Tax=Halobacteriovorax marinus TaxID=97084 RepID=A0A1Y5F5P3_9BACT|nr:hypothetical protein A9Q84_07570 [Halobacteriovorax marinus]
MSQNETFKKKTSSVFVTIFIGFIVVSFMFTGYQSFTGSPNAVAKVGDEPIKIADYQREFNRQLEFYRGLLGGKDLTNQQIQQFRLKETALRNLVQGKLTLILGDRIGVIPSSEEIKFEIKKFPYFQVNKQFSVDRYKSILASNRMNPQDFEKDMRNQVRGMTTDAVLKGIPVSKQYFLDVSKFKEQKLNAVIVEINKEAMRKQIKVTNSEVETYLKEEANLGKVTSLFNERKSALDTKEEVKASHILFRTDDKNAANKLKALTKLRMTLTKKNFAKQANKHTEDPSGQGKGGTLGWFTKGRMVPEFDAVAFNLKPGTISKPIKTSFGYHVIYVQSKKEAKEAKFEDFKVKFSKEILRKTKNTELDSIVAKVQAMVASSIGNSKKISKLKQKYGLKVEENLEINRLDGSTGKILLEANNLKGIFAKGLDQSSVYTFDRATNVVILKSFKFTNGKKQSKKDILDGNNSLRTILGRKLKQEILKDLESTVKVVEYGVL